MGGKVSILINVSSQKVLPFQQSAEKTAFCVNHFDVASLIFGLLFYNIVMKFFLSWDYLMFVIVTLTFVMLRKLQYCMWVQIKLSHFNRLKNGVLCYFSGVVSRVVGLLFLIMLMKFVFNRLPDVYHSYSDICDGWKDFDFVVCVFRSSFPFSLTEKRCCCVNGVDRVSLFCFFNHLVETCGWKINWSLPQFFWQLQWFGTLLCWYM